jgi:hypothetical protein
MKKPLIILLMLTLVFMVACSNDQAAENNQGNSDAKTPSETPSAPVDDPTDPEEPTDDTKEINMQNYTLTVPSNYELLKGGHDGIRYHNAVLKPKGSVAYEIELEYGIFFINNIEERKTTIMLEYGASAMDVSTDEFKQSGTAYSYTFDHSSRGTVLAIELVTGTNPIYYMRGFIDVFDDQGLSDPQLVLRNFIASNITMVEIKAD